MDIQHTLTTKDADIHYLGSSMFSVSVKDADFKKANIKLAAVIAEIEARAKKHALKIEIK